MMVCLGRGRKGSRQLKRVDDPSIPPPLAPLRMQRGGRMQRVTRLLALALKFEGLLRDGVVADYAELARLGQVSRARISQIMNLLNLAVDIQEEILFLPPTLRGKHTLTMAKLQGVALTPMWERQRVLWGRLMSCRSKFRVD